jgi:hypothetical protein
MITTSLNPPLPSDDLATFNSKAFSTLAALNPWATEANETAADVNADAASALNSKNAAAASASAAETSRLGALSAAAAAATSAGAAAFVSGATYTAITSTAVSLVNFRVYRARTTGVRTVDPANDPTNWAIAGGELVLIPVSGTTQTAAAGGRYALRNAGATVLTAPPSPQPGDRFAVKVANGLTTNTINWNGAKHENLSDATSSMEHPRYAAEFVYIDATYGWGVI